MSAPYASFCVASGFSKQFCGDAAGLVLTLSVIVGAAADASIRATLNSPSLFTGGTDTPSLLNSSVTVSRFDVSGILYLFRRTSAMRFTPVP